MKLTTKATAPGFCWTWSPPNSLICRSGQTQRHCSCWRGPEWSWPQKDEFSGTHCPLNATQCGHGSGWHPNTVRTMLGFLEFLSHSRGIYCVLGRERRLTCREGLWLFVSDLHTHPCCPQAVLASPGPQGSCPTATWRETPGHWEELLFPWVSLTTPLTCRFENFTLGNAFSWHTNL